MECACSLSKTIAFSTDFFRVVGLAEEHTCDKENLNIITKDKMPAQAFTRAIDFCNMLYIWSYIKYLGARLRI